MAISEVQILSGSDTLLRERCTECFAELGNRLREVLLRSVEIAIRKPRLVGVEEISDYRGRGAHLLVPANVKVGGEPAGILAVLTPLASTIAMTSFARHLPDAQALANRNTGEWTADDENSFPMIANTILECCEQSLREHSNRETSLEIGSFEVLAKGVDPDASVFGDSALLMVPLSWRVGEFAEERGAILFPLEAAEALNDEPLRFVARDDDGDEEDIEPAPIRGKLAAYVAHADVIKVVRRACRRVGLECDRRPSSEVPNPSAFEDTIVLIEIGPGDERRFDWCRRLKIAGSALQVVLLLKEPTRRSVALAFRAAADTVLGFPTRERQLSIRLEELLELPADVG